MEIIKAGDPERISAIRVGPEDDSTIIIIPPDRDLELETVELVLTRTGLVPLTTIRFSLPDWLELTEKMYDGLINNDWPQDVARQILPRGG
jgi:hypothetical protein